MRIVVESPSTLGDREMPTARVSPAPSAQSSDQSSIHGVVTTSSRDANHQNNSHNHVSSSRVQPRFSRDVTSSSSSSPSSGVICGERDVIIDASETGVRTSSSTSSTVTATCPSSVETHLSNGLRHVETVHESSNNSTKGHLESRKQIIRKNGVQLFRQDHSEGHVVVDKMHLMPSSRSTALHKKVVRSSNDTHTGKRRFSCPFVSDILWSHDNLVCHRLVTIIMIPLCMTIITEGQGVVYIALQRDDDVDHDQWQRRPLDHDHTARKRIQELCRKTCLQIDRVFLGAKS